jgi:hypothetical protein
MSHPLKDLFARIGLDLDSTDVVHLGCEVEQTNKRLQTKIANTPTKESSQADVLAYCLEVIRKGGKTLVKEARKKELELEMRLLDKPDEVDLGSDEHKHTALHLEEEQLQAEAGKREGAVLLLFCDLVESRLGEDFN